MREIKKVLVANRGEIALRIIRSAREMGMRTVAVYANQDIMSQYARQADQAFALEGTTHTETYLNQEKILEIARETGADAVHPGYGFLSENPEFAQAVQDAGMAWIGPAPKVIERLGDKIRARKVAESVQVSPVPGLSEPVASLESILDFAGTHGYPIVLKKADGGGGRGISVLRTDDEVRNFYAQHNTSHGSDLDLYFVERFVAHARHLETQCAADMHGNFNVVSTRDCSVQRRNQKLIEEAPAPFLPTGIEEQMVESSRRLFQEVGYVGLGTCEFMLEEDGSLWFLEVNPRLQVEHTVSEEVSGLDLVREQFRIAKGKELTPVGPTRGHSIEFRITSEDPANQLMPSAGEIQRLEWPAGPGVRLDLGIEEGDTVSPDFDSMLAKVIITGPDRPAAIARSRRALSEIAIEGVASPIEIYQEILDREEFVAVEGDFAVTTKWLEENILTAPRRPSRFAPPEAKPEEERATYVIEVNGQRMELTVPAKLVQRGTERLQAQPLRSHRTLARSAATDQANQLGADGAIASPMQAIVIRIVVEVGQHVGEGDLLVVLESMKMETYLHAPCAGTVREIVTTPGDTVTSGQPLLRLDKEEK